MDMTNEELADRLEAIAAVRVTHSEDPDGSALREAAARLRQQSEDSISYPIAKRAIKIFEGEYVGQSVPDLWLWCVDKARRND